MVKKRKVEERFWSAELAYEDDSDNEDVCRQRGWIKVINKKVVSNEGAPEGKWDLAPK